MSTTIAGLTTLTSYSKDDFFLVEHSNVSYKCSLAKLSEILLTSTDGYTPVLGTSAHPAGNIFSNGTLTVGGATALSSASLSSTLSVSGATTLNSTLGVSGNTTLSGTLGVSKKTTLSDELAVSKTATFSDQLKVTKDTESSSKTTGAVIIAGGLGVAKTIYANAANIPTLTAETSGTFGKSTTTASTVTCQVYGKLNVTGNAAIGGDLEVTGDVSAASGTFTDLSITNEVTFSSLKVNGNTQLGLSSTTTTLACYSTPTFYKDTTIGTSTAGANLTVYGTINGQTLSVDTNKFIISNGTASLTVNAAAVSISGATTISATTSISGATTISAATTISKATTISAITSIAAALTVNKALTVGAASTYTGAVTITSAGTSDTVIRGPNDGTITLPANISGNDLARVLVQTTNSSGTLTPDWVDYTNANTGGTMVLRDSNGNFSAGTITASLTGTASKATGDGAGNTITSTYFNKTTTTAQSVAAATTFGSTVNVKSTTYLGGASNSHHVRIYVDSGNKKIIQSYNNSTADTLYLNYGGGNVYLSGTSGAYANATGLYNAVWADLVDTIVVDDKAVIEPGYCYCFDGKKYYKSTKYMDDGIVGLESDTYGFVMGERNEKHELHVAVAGFVLAYVDKVYKPGTPLTCTKDGRLTKMGFFGRLLHPEKVLGTFWKTESAKTWGTEAKKIKVNGRCWIKVK